MISSQTLWSRTFKTVFIMKRIQDAVKSNLNDLEEERSLCKRLFLKDFSSLILITFSKNSQPKFFNSSQQKPKLRPTKDFESKYNKFKAKLALLNSGTSTSKSSMVKNKGLVAKAYEWDEKRVLESVKNGEWVKISMIKVHALFEMEDNDERKTFLDYLCIDLNYVEEQRNNLVLKHRDLVQELNTCKEQLLILKQAKLDFLTMQHVNTEILKENQNLRKELKELTTIIETWLNSSNKVNQCISEQIPTQKKRILGVDQLTEDPSSSGQKYLVFVNIQIFESITMNLGSFGEETDMTTDPTPTYSRLMFLAAGDAVHIHVTPSIIKPMATSMIWRDDVHKSIFSLFPLFVKPTLSLTIMGDKNSNRPRTLGDYSRPSQEGYQDAIELPEGDKIQHLKDFLRIVDSIDLNGATRNTTRLCLFCFSLHDQAINWLDFPHHGLDLWLHVQIFYDHVDYTTQMAIDYVAGGRLRKLRPEEAWKTIEDLAQYEEEE
ncbi:hypothetical protein Tco_1533625 [Tanacetum coccineum]